MTIKDVAKLAGVSVSTVSRYINNSGIVSAKTQAKIRKAIEELDYIPSLNAQSLKSRESKIFALILPDLRNSFFVELAENVEKECLDRGYNLIICNLNHSLKKENVYISMIKRVGIDGVMASSGTNLRRHLDKIPMVLWERMNFDEVQGYQLITNHEQGVRLAVKHLHEIGCEKVLYLHPYIHNFPSYIRMKEFKKTCRKYGILGETAGFNDLQRSFDRIDYKNYDAIFCWNDDTAIDLIFYAQEKGINIPEDIKVVGFDNTNLSSRVKPGLTTIEQSTPEIAKIMVKTLIDIMNEKIELNGTKKINVQTKLVVRESTSNK
ncbi:LacI family DNA-binding transcriptional regulator [Helcococcus sueciensis]|uniref:LacI family DNA-binding transcriptional regulator n=1 Tax=Helcococcus sueciensis TaxID=241555 RepID=UPI0004006860|nr:LacI family DNA-binding transcriptional regulator [Helcococcus sueciensis]